MNEKQFFSLIIFFISTLIGQSQNNLSNKTIEVIYVKAYKNHKDTTSAVPKLMKNLEYQLLCNSTEASFKYISSMSNDGDNTNERFIGKGGGQGVYYKNLRENEKLHQIESIDERTYLIREDFNKYDWKLLKETKKILGYDCFKAVASFKFFSQVRKRDVTLNITAWYTPNIPVPFGPSGYDGLPGLVLESSTSSFHLIAKNIKFNNELKKIVRPKKGTKITFDEFNKILLNNLSEFKEKD